MGKGSGGSLGVRGEMCDTEVRDCGEGSGSERGAWFLVLVLSHMVLKMGIKPGERGGEREEEKEKERERERERQREVPKWSPRPEVTDLLIPS
jgi:hypothetical protein